MRLTEGCVACIYRKQRALTDNKDYLTEIENIVENRAEEDSSPYLGYLIGRVYERYFGKKSSMREVKNKYNDLVLSMEDAIRRQIEESKNPIQTALMYSRVGNYIDFSAVKDVNEEDFLGLFAKASFSESDIKMTQKLISECENAKTFLLVADNCGEIVLDKLVLEQIKKKYPSIKIYVMVRGGEASNDVTREDAAYVHLDDVAEIIDSGLAMTGMVYKLLPDKSREIMDRADVILAKGQGNYETLSEQGFHIFYLFLCKCEYFVTKFNVKPLTGMFIEERAAE